MAGVTEIGLSISAGTDGWWHARMQTLGGTEDEARAVAGSILDRIVGDRECFVRTRPEARTDTNFETMTKTVIGYCRFSFADHPGPRHDTTDDPVKIPYLGGRVEC